MDQASSRAAPFPHRALIKAGRELRRWHAFVLTLKFREVIVWLLITTLSHHLPSSSWCFNKKRLVEESPLFSPNSQTTSQYPSAGLCEEQDEGAWKKAQTTMNSIKEENAHLNTWHRFFSGYVNPSRLRMRPLCSMPNSLVKDLALCNIRFSWRPSAALITFGARAHAPKSRCTAHVLGEVHSPLAGKVRCTKRLWLLCTSSTLILWQASGSVSKSPSKIIAKHLCIWSVVSFIEMDSWCSILPNQSEWKCCSTKHFKRGQGAVRPLWGQLSWQPEPVKGEAVMIFRLESKSIG